ncbi:unnamed protein product, partial [Ectocarpus sp. 13 AM-2016]
MRSDPSFITPERSPLSMADGKGEAFPELLPGPAERRSVVTALRGAARIVGGDSEGGLEAMVTTAAAAVAAAQRPSVLPADGDAGEEEGGGVQEEEDGVGAKHGEEGAA